MSLPVSRGDPPELDPVTWDRVIGTGPIDRGPTTAGEAVSNPPPFGVTHE